MHAFKKVINLANYKTASFGIKVANLSNPILKLCTIQLLMWVNADE